MQALLKLSDGAAALCRLVGRTGAWLIVPLILIISFDVVTRKLPFVQNFIQTSWLHDFLSATKLQEFEWHLHAVVFLLAYGLAYLDGSHVRVDVWREHRAPRTRGWIEVIGILLLAMPFCAVLVYHSWHFVVTAWVQNEGSASITGVPHRWIVKSFVLIGTALLFLSLTATLMRLVAYLFGDAATAREASLRLGVANITDPQPDAP
jgi:TRAP-type mannitol/chloroaromatic compound transport system permease small subunit